MASNSVGNLNQEFQKEHNESPVAGQPMKMHVPFWGRVFSVLRVIFLVVGVMSLGSALYMLVYSFGQTEVFQQPGNMDAFAYIIFPPVLFLIGAPSYFMGLYVIKERKSELLHFMRWLGSLLLLLIVILYIAFIVQ